MTAPLRTGLAALAALSLLAAPLAAQTSGEIHCDAADPMIGTGGEGHTFPGAVAPFGMIQLSPDTDTSCVIRKCYSHAAGYRHEDPTIQGFSMTHFSGAGHSDLGDFLDPADRRRRRSAGARRLSFALRPRERSGRAGLLRRHARAPGHPRPDDGGHPHRRAALRISRRPERASGARSAQLALQLSGQDHCGRRSASAPTARSPGSRETRRAGRRPGSSSSQSGPRARWPAMPSSTARRGSTIRAFRAPSRGADDARQLAGRALVARLDFGRSTGRSERRRRSAQSTRTAPSPISTASPAVSTRSAPPTRGAWEQALGAIEIDGTRAMKKTVATALYHSLIAPSVFSDADGPLSRAGRSGPSQARASPSTRPSRCGTRFAPSIRCCCSSSPSGSNADFVNSLIASRQVSPFGILPVWQFHGRETWTMIGYHAVPVIADAYLKGIRGFDADAALEAMVWERDLWPLWRA